MLDARISRLGTERVVRLSVLFACGLALAGCANGPQPIADNNVFKQAAAVPGFTTTVGDPKDFVKATRGADGEVDYRPVGVTPPQRPSAAISFAEADTKTATLDGERGGSQGVARRPLPASAVSSPATPDAALAEQRRRLGDIRAKAAARPETAADILAEQRRRLAAISGKSPAGPPSDLRKEAEAARKFARRPLPAGVPTAVPAEQPSSWPVPERMRRPVP